MHIATKKKMGLKGSTEVRFVSSQKSRELNGRQRETEKPENPVKGARAIKGNEGR